MKKQDDECMWKAMGNVWKVWRGGGGGEKKKPPPPHKRKNGHPKAEKK